MKLSYKAVCYFGMLATMLMLGSANDSVNNDNKVIATVENDEHPAEKATQETISNLRSDPYRPVPGRYGPPGPDRDDIYICDIVNFVVTRGTEIRRCIREGEWFFRMLPLVTYCLADCIDGQTSSPTSSLTSSPTVLKQ
mmetsp:Transcript_29712/g.36176  ORF Transcript_29712/g.36176 Transcript_29712/m.36176 type:complete len:139 (+) Transcript_29712:69-485(+)